MSADFQGDKMCTGGLLIVDGASIICFSRIIWMIFSMKSINKVATNKFWRSLVANGSLQNLLYPFCCMGTFGLWSVPVILIFTVKKSDEKGSWRRSGLNSFCSNPGGLDSLHSILICYWILGFIASSVSIVQPYPWGCLYNFWFSLLQPLLAKPL